LAPARAAAEPNETKEPNAQEPPCPRTAERRALAFGAAFVPGALAHGAGHYVLCERHTAKTLLAVEGAGVGLAAGSATGLALTGASRYFVAPFALGLWGGASLFAFGLLADVYGVAAPEGGFGRAPHKLARVVTETGVRYVYDPQFRYHAFVSHGFRLDTRWLWLAPRFDVALDAKNHRYSLLAGHRVLGPSSFHSVAKGTRVDFQLGVSDHDYGDEGFAMRIWEGSLAVRLDLNAIGPTLRGSFAEIELGYAREISRFDGLSGEGSDELLAHGAFGAYIGQGQGEFKLSYDHRRDTLAGGLRVPGIAAGYLGYLSQRTEVYFGTLGVASEVAYGSALMVSAFLLVQVGR
jgi:hypothetical protein